MAERNDQKQAKFLGQSASRVDHKGRAAFPARLRGTATARWGERPDLMLTVFGTQPCLVLVERGDWFARKPSTSGLDYMDEDAADFRRLSAFSEPCDIDAQGRVTIPPFLRAYAGIEEEALFVGCEDYIEVWNPATAAQKMAELLQQSREVIRRVRDKAEQKLALDTVQRTNEAQNEA